jgi:transcriptional regulator with XRE-family HTH domain
MHNIEQKVNIQIGINIRNKRKELRLNQSILSESIGISYQQLQNYELGKNRAPACKLYKIAKALNMPIEYFFSGIDPETDLKDL